MWQGRECHLARPLIECKAILKHEAINAKIFNRVAISYPLRSYFDRRHCCAEIYLMSLWLSVYQKSMVANFLSCSIPKVGLLYLPSRSQFPKGERQTGIWAANRNMDLWFWVQSARYPLSHTFTPANVTYLLSWQPVTTKSGCVAAQLMQVIWDVWPLRSMRCAKLTTL